LSSRISKVVAIDPAELNINPLPVNVIHIKLKVQDAVPRIAELAPYDLLTCDTNLDPREVCRLLVVLKLFLKPTARVIVTLKLTQGYSFKSMRDKLLEEAVEIIQNYYSSIQLLWLLSNGNERTLTATLK